MTTTILRDEFRGREKPSALIQQYLRDMIFSGKFRPGDWLRLEDIGAEYGVSTTPVREAIAVLVDEGLLEARTRKGITVLPFSSDDVLESYHLTGVVSGRIAERAALRMSPATIEEI